MFELDPTQLALGVLFGGIGFVAYRYGRRMEVSPPIVIGLALMIYPLFVSDALWLSVIGAGLTAALWFFRE